MSNVLVYSGPGVSASALSHTLRTLRILLPSYDVQCISAQSLAIDPWMETTSLLVLPGGRDLPYIDKLAEYWPVHSSAAHPSHARMNRADARVREYVSDRGGNFIGICAGAYYASSYCEFEKGNDDMQVVGERQALEFFPGKCEGTVFPGFVYESDQGARLIHLRDEQSPSSLPYMTYYNGGGAFIDSERYLRAGIQVLARYMSEEDAQSLVEGGATPPNRIKKEYVNQAAVILCSAGRGRALLYGTHPEFPLSSGSKSVMSSVAPETVPNTLSFEQMEKNRLAKFAAHLQLLGLDVDHTHLAPKDPKLSPLVLTGQTNGIVNSVLSSLRPVHDPQAPFLAASPQQGLLTSVVDSNDTIHIYEKEQVSNLFRLCAGADYFPYSSPVVRANADEARAGEDGGEVEVDLQRVPKYIIALSHPGAIDERWTPHWNTSKFFSYAEESRTRIRALKQEQWSHTHAPAEERLSDILLYAETITSTQTMLDRNYKLITRLPSGLTSFATHQVSGRGRGKNAWISPLGCLQFSTVLRLPHPQELLWSSGAAGVVFIQYLAGLAIVESVHSGILGMRYKEALGGKIRIKWPNDVYAEVETHDSTETRKGTFTWRGKKYAKMAGVLVNSQFAGSELAIVVGCGINTLNARPTTSLSDLIDTYNNRNPGAPLPTVSQEQFAGAIIATFERMWNTFLEAGGSFQPFVDAYRRAWLHS